MRTSRDVRPRAVYPAETRALQRQAIDSTLDALDSMLKEVAEKRVSHDKRLSTGSTRKSLCGQALPKWRFCDPPWGGGVLPRHQYHKLALRWVGPYRIVQVLTGFIFILQHLVAGEKCEVHGSRNLFFRNSDFDVTKEVIEHLEYQTGEIHTVSEFFDVRVW
jgi:hypothetical protein